MMRDLSLQSSTQPRVSVAVVALVATFWIVVSAFGGPARPGWTKVELTRLEGAATAAPAALLTAFGAELVSDYGTFAVAMVPGPALEGMNRAARAHGVSLRQRDDLDLLHCPGATVDVRRGLVDVPPDGLSRPYAPRQLGLFTMQFAGPPRPEWIAELRAIGWRFARYLPENGYIVIGVPEMVARTRQLSFVQWLDLYHPYQKYKQLPSDGALRSLLFILPSGPELTEALEEIRVASVGEISITRTALDVLVSATMSRGAAEKILHHALVLGVEPQPVLGLSDERQSISLSLGSTQTAPPSPRQSYWTWVTQQCPKCASMTAAEWKLGFVDFGLDNGSPTGGHADFAGRKYYGLRPDLNFKCPNTLGQPLGCDHEGHGTAVVSVAAGAASGDPPQADGGGYYFGEGVAPRAGIFMTSYSFDQQIPNSNNLEIWVDDAASNGVTVQNHSFNDYSTSDPDTSGIYTSFARRYDALVRDAEKDPDANGADVRTPVLLTVSAGNTDQGVQSSYKGLVVAGATAKNVIAVSGTESVRTVPQPCHGCASDSYQNIMAHSRIGTRMNASYIKPDLVAPASAVVAAVTTAVPSVNEKGCQNIESSTDYFVESGTSFASPVAAGAAILAKVHLGSAPGSTSPALIKAALIAGAQSIRDGQDRSHTPAATIGAVPNVRQGFGRVSLVDILTTPAPLTYDENVTRTFTQAGQKLVGRIRVTDSSKPVKVVLVWTDSPAAESSAENYNPLVNDLNLRILPAASSTTLYLGNRLSAAETATVYDRTSTVAPDNVNNVEVSRFSATANELFDVEIVAAKIAGDTNGKSPETEWEQDFALVILNAEQVSALDWETVSAPQNFKAITNGTSVTLSWNAVANASSYTVQYKNSSGAWTSLAPVSSTSTTDTPTSTSGVVLYRVRANSGTSQSGPSNRDVAFVGAFTDDPLLGSPSYTTIKAVHMTELRRAVNGLRQIAGASDVYDANALNATLLKSLFIDDSDFTSLLEQINSARALAEVSMPAVAFGSPAPAGSPVPSKVGRTHVEDLRHGFRTLAP